MATNRALQKRDLPALKRLHRFAKFEGSPVFGEDQTGVAELLASACNSLDGVTGSCCEDSDGVFGAITLQEELFPDQAHQEDRPLIILTVVVRADMRASGVASSLLSTAEQQASKNGNTSLITDVSSHNRPAISFFLRHGFLERKNGGLTTELYKNLSCAPERHARFNRPESTAASGLGSNHNSLHPSNTACSGNRHRSQLASRPLARAGFRPVITRLALHLR